MILPNLSDLPVLKPYHLLMLSFRVNHRGLQHFPARVLLSCIMDPEESSWRGKSAVGSGHQRVAGGNLSLGGKDPGSACKVHQEEGRKCSGQAAVSLL